MLRFHDDRNGDNERTDTLHLIWIEGTIAFNNSSLLHHPRTSPAASRVVYQPPVLEVSTAAYADVEKFLEAVKNEHIRRLGHKVVGVLGDWQTFNRMWHLKIHDASFSWLVPLPGEFHFTWHVGQSMYILWWNHLFGWVANKGNMEKTMKPPSDMDHCENIQYVDHFLQLCLQSSMKYLSDVLGPDYMQNVAYDDMLREWTPKCKGEWERTRVARARACMNHCMNDSIEPSRRVTRRNRDAAALSPRFRPAVVALLAQRHPSEQRGQG